MEQSVNTFAKGLLMDTHPMVLGTDTLSDCLNGTIITMSGNEVILQNDMGNRKIDNALLPSGYEPVGMKEYGGIIYIAAYNPLTNRGLLGSFPSPLRKLSINNSEYNLLLTNFLDIKNENISIKVDNITIPISNGLVLHTGDKFSVYSNEIRNIIQYLVPTESLGIKKNNLFSFQIGIFNSQNEFVDISDKLINQEIEIVKQENNNDITYTYNYYITENSGIDLNLQSQNTLNDLKLLEARNSIAINTYSYKMSSPLYLRAKLNHVNSISYTIDGDIVRESGGTKNVNFYISVTYNYNCKDNINGNYFKLIFNGQLCSSKEEDPSSNLKFSPTYLVESDEYLVTLNYEILVKEITSTEYSYKLEFPLLHDFELFTFKDSDNNVIPIIQNNLTLENSIDISLLGSDTAIFSGYRYLFNNTSKLVTLELDIESYPKKVGSSYEIIPVIYEGDGNNINEHELTPIQGEKGNSPTSGVYTITFNYELLGLVERKLYHIKLQKYLDNNYVNLFGYDGKPGLFITTPIFNGNYIGSKAFEERITLATIDNKTGGYEYEVAKDDYIDNFLKIKYLLLNPIINVTTNKYSAKKGLEIEGQLINERDYELPTSTYDIQELYEVNTEINPTISLNNIELYPSELDDKFNIKLGSLDIQVIGREIDGNLVEKTIDGIYKYSKNLVETRGSYTSDTNNIEDVIEITLSTVGLKITTNVTVHNFIQGNVIEASILCNRVITSLYDFIVKHYFDNSGFFHISDPYVTIDFEGTSSKLGVRLDYGTISNLTFNEDDNEKIFTTTSIHNQTIVNDFFRLKTGNLLLLEYSSNDYLIGRLPVYKGYDGRQGIKRIWMRVSEKEYTPIFAESGLYSNENLSIDIFNDDSWEFRYLLDSIPHYYSYSEDSKTIERKIIDYHNLATTKEFNVTSNANVNISCTTSLNISSTYYKIKNPETITLINILEDNIKSNNIILEDLNVLSSRELDCVVEKARGSLSSATTDRIIIYKDREGNLFDPSYMYYIYDWNDSNKGLLKSYRPDKFYIDDLKCNFPELKDSGLLYLASNGKRHPYVNPIVSPTKSRRLFDEERTIGWLKNISIYNDSKIGTYYTYDFSSLYSLLQKTSDDYFIGGNSYASYSLPAFLTIDNNKVGYDNRVTMAQYEPGEDERWFSYATFTSRNIFDLNTIETYDLYYWEGEDNENPMKDGWKPADDFISK